MRGVSQVCGGGTDTVSMSQRFVSPGTQGKTDLLSGEKRRRTRAEPVEGTIMSPSFEDSASLSLALRHVAAKGGRVSGLGDPQRGSWPAQPQNCWAWLQTLTT